MSRWYNHINSYTKEFDSLSGSSKAGEAFIGGSSEAPAAAAADDDDDVDLFGSDDEEEDAEAEKLKAERVAAYNAKKAASEKPKIAAKVCSVLTPSSLLMTLTLAILVCCHPRGEALGR